MSSVDASQNISSISTLYKQNVCYYVIIVGYYYEQFYKRNYIKFKNQGVSTNWEVQHSFKVVLVFLMFKEDA